MSDVCYWGEGSTIDATPSNLTGLGPCDAEI